MPNKPFLLTTPDPAFLDLNAEEFILLGDWCLNDKTKKILSGKKYEILDSPWTDDFIASSGKYSLDLAKYWLPHLSRILNNEHKVKKSENYWRILLTSWLLEYIEFTYVKYLLIKKAKETFGQFYTWFLNDEHFIKLKSSGQLRIFLANNETYHFQVCTIVAEAMDIQGFKKDYRTSGKAHTAGAQKYFKNFLWRFIYPILKKEIIIDNVGLTLLDKLKYPMFTGHNSCADGAFNLHPKYAASSKRFNRNCFNKLPTRNRFEDILKNSLDWGFPESCGEYFEENYQTTKYQFNNTRLVITSQLEHPELMNFLGAIVVENGGKLISFQHGGAYGHYELYGYPQEMIERFKANLFLSWGWKDKENENLCKVEPIAVPYLSTLVNKYKRKNDNLIFVGANPLILPFRLSYVFLRSNKYFILEQKLLKLISPEINAHLIYKKGRNQETDCEKELQNKFPDLNMTSTNLINLMKECEMAIMPFLSTSFIEALVMNVPTVLLLDQNIFTLRESAKPQFDLLANVGIVYKTPEKATDFINETIRKNRTEQWWNCQETQTARNIFIHQYGLTSSNIIKVWKKFIAQELSSIKF